MPTNEKEVPSSFLTVTPVQLAQALATALENDIPAMVWGPPGCGKSAIIRQTSETYLAEPLDHTNYIDFRANQHDPVDLVGIPSVEDKRTKWNVPSFLPSDGNGVMNIEELPNAHRSMQSALYPLIYYPRRIGDYWFPSGWRFLLSGNRQNDHGGTFEMPTPLKNRMLHFELATNISDWTSWATVKRIDPMIIGFLNFRTDLLCAIDHSAWASPTPRTWEMLSTIIDGDSSTPFQMIQACVGTGTATEFAGWLGNTLVLPTFAEIIEDHELVKPHLGNMGNCYALIANFISSIQDISHVDKIMPAVVLFPIEFQTIFMRGIDDLNQEYTAHPQVVQWYDRNMDLLLS